jgi:hypothetical protein
MINGLQVDVKSVELKGIIKSRIEYHTDKAQTYEKQAGKLKEGKAREHKDKAIHFQFLLDHVILDDVYRLGPSDLQLLGIASRGY